MDPEVNPYTPNAGAAPPLLAGREDLLGTFTLLLRRLLNGFTEQSMIITGLRGVGKTVLLGEFRKRAESLNWAVVETEVSKHDDTEFRKVIARESRRALFAIAPSARWKDAARRAAGVLRSFSLALGTDGSITAGLNVPPIDGLADSGLLAADMTDVMVALGEAALDHDTGVLYLLDEIQFLRKAQMEALIASLHKTVQRALPITMVAAGLPQLPELAGEAKSYSERLFKFPPIGQLSGPEARLALVEPARQQQADYDPAALDFIVDYTEGYPYFVQEFGKAVWDTAPGRVITPHDAHRALDVVESKLDSSFFRVRLDRTTDLERAYLRAMAELGPDAQQAGDVAAMLHRTSQQVAPTRARLIDKGLLYTPSYGAAAFTVPQFDRYLKRTMAFAVPPKRDRTRRLT